MQAHSSRPECSGCHAIIDPPGFLLESYDADAVFRSVYRDGSPIDTIVDLATGGSYEDPMELIDEMIEDGSFMTCALQHLLSYALHQSRTYSADEKKHVFAVAHKAQTQEMRVSEVIVQVVLSDYFRTYSTINNISH